MIKMKKLNFIIVTFGFLILTGCSSRRIDMIGEVFGIILSDKYEVLKNETTSVGFAGTDFNVKVELKFQVKEFEELKYELLKIDSLKTESENKYWKRTDHETATLEIEETTRLLKFEFDHI